MSLIKKLLGKKESTCCEVKIEEVQQQNNQCCNVKIEEVQQQNNQCCSSE